MFSIWICLELVVYFLVLVFLNNISITFVSKKKIMLLFHTKTITVDDTKNR